MTNEPDDLEDLLPDFKGRAAPLKRTPGQKKALARAEKKIEAESLEKARAERLAQIVNLHISGMSLSAIGASIGATADEVDRMLAQDAQRYVRSQPALRVYVRNWISEKYMKMIEADYKIATDETHREKLENQDRVVRMLDRMSKLHGADAPVQSEVKVEAAPEAVEKLVAALSAQQGLGYDTSVFDIVDAEVVEEAVGQSETAVLDSGERVGEAQDGDAESGF